MGRGSQQVVGAVNPSCVSQTFNDEALRKVVDTINYSVLQTSHRKRRSSVNRPDIVDDHEPPSAASPTTPVLQTPALPLPTSETARDESDAQPDLPARSPTPNARSPSVERSRKHGLDILMGVSPSSATYRYETPLERQAPPVPRSTYNRRSDTPPQVPSPHPPHVPVAPPDISAESTDDGGVPAYTPNTAQD
ncbi:hypothetical protein BGW80DRAFT_1565574 [Lactifluus volemus]|nr:hypothetical protein BGW80DRAFT_1565574 [Lactifluus volemus]